MLNISNILAIGLIEVEVLFGACMIVLLIGAVKQIFPCKNNGQAYKNSGYEDSESLHETYYDEGFLSDLESFDDRIEAMKLEANAYDGKYDDVPAVEIITDEYEEHLEKGLY